MAAFCHLCFYKHKLMDIFKMNKRLCVCALTLISLLPVTAKTSGNPILPGWYADPEAIVYGDEVWIFPTLSDCDSLHEAPVYLRETGAMHRVYNLQTYLDAYSSKDLVNWELHHKVLSTDSVKWADYSMWAPSVIHANDKYYLFFSANDIQKNGETGGIGVAVADTPAGPYSDALGHPLIGEIVEGAQPIDQFVFRDDDGSYYMYYGGWHHCNMVKLSDDLLSIVPFDDGSLYKPVTPERYVEGPFMFKRNGIYYFMWSEGSWEGADYSVAYAMADSPYGPFKRIGVILEQDPEIATGAGHHSIFRYPGSDDWYIVYHRRPAGDDGPNHRATCIDRLYFDKDNRILPVKITREGVAGR